MEKLKTTSDTRSEKPLIFLPNGEKHMLKNGKLQTANDTRTENPTLFSAKLKTEKPTYKIPKLKPTPAPILSKEFLYILTIRALL